MLHSEFIAHKSPQPATQREKESPVNLLSNPLTISTSLSIAAALVPQIAAALVIVFLVVFAICIFLICLEEDLKSFGNGNEINEVKPDDGREGEEDSRELRLTHSEPIPEKWLDEYVNIPHPLPAALHQLPNQSPNQFHDFRPGDFLTCIDDSGVQHYIRNGEQAWFLRNHTEEGRLIWVRTNGAVKGVFCSSPGRFEKRKVESING
jgi:hypothetical protein